MAARQPSRHIMTFLSLIFFYLYISSFIKNFKRDVELLKEYRKLERVEEKEKLEGNEGREERRGRKANPLKYEKKQLNILYSSNNKKVIYNVNEYIEENFQPGTLGMIGFYINGGDVFSTWEIKYQSEKYLDIFITILESHPNISLVLIPITRNPE